MSKRYFSFPYPKKLLGCLPLELNISPSDSLLGIQAAKIAALQKLARSENPGSEGVIQWFHLLFSSFITIYRVVMTSKSTEHATREHLKKVVPEAGLNWEQITIFSQAEIPAFDTEGNVLMASKSSIVTSPSRLFPVLNPLLFRWKWRHLFCFVSSSS